MRWVLLLLLLIPLGSQADEPEPDLTKHPTIKKLYAKNAEIRAKLGLKEQTLSPELTKAAQDHAWYMARMHDKGEEDFNHRGGNGTPGERAAKYSYTGTVRENIARGYKSIDATFEAWRDSAEHWGSIIGDATEVGFGYARAKDGTTYWVGVYGRPKEKDKKCKPDLPSSVFPSSSELTRPFLLISS